MHAYMRAVGGVKLRAQTPTAPMAVRGVLPSRAVGGAHTRLEDRNYAPAGKQFKSWRFIEEAAGDRLTGPKRMIFYTNRESETAEKSASDAICESRDGDAPLIPMSIRPCCHHRHSVRRRREMPWTSDGV